MHYIPRTATAQVRKAARNFPAVLLTGPRQCGKTTLLQHVFPRQTYPLEARNVKPVGNDPGDFRWVEDPVFSMRYKIHARRIHPERELTLLPPVRGSGC